MSKPIQGPLCALPGQNYSGTRLCLVDERGRVIALSLDVGTYERACKAYGATFERLAQAWNVCHEIQARLNSEPEWDSETMSDVANILHTSGFELDNANEYEDSQS